ncbi:RIP metalloprotease RseP [Candidatus Parabeggiatoa sp. HSG14]|uniref:RIP metalloprotease RseP n=1 Tax=Candidatus Parabeggiatoa sp. HSG14 TaxID=3055593 RepID=UPI0025A74135|nr:RIP metalloprotease RseP [Thiotrichales bacterium HSG14]
MVILQTLLAFIVVIGILVTVHEFGHYWVAQRLGVKILRFSIGFGKPLWSRRFGVDKTEFVIAAIPLGGYVKMLDEHEGEVSKKDLPRAFNQQSLKVRTAIVVAGPLFNFLFAIVAYTAMSMVGVTGIKALVNDVTPQSVAEQAGFMPGDAIVSVNEQPVKSWERVIQSTLHQLLDNKNEVSYSVQDERGYQRDLSLNLTDFTIDDIVDKQFFNKLGIQLFPAILGDIIPNSAASISGLQTGDKVIALDKKPIEDWRAWALYVSQHPGKEIHAEIERNHQIVELTLIPDNVNSKGRMGVYANYRPEFVFERYGLFDALIQGVSNTWEYSVLTLRVMVKMLTLQVSYQHISGPISIAEYAGKSAQIGLSAFLSFLGLVSVSLGVINLLPIPLLDGGHLLLFLIEWLKGSPVTENTEYFLQRIGLTLLFGLMGLAIFNDLERLFS